MFIEMQRKVCISDAHSGSTAVQFATTKLLTRYEYHGFREFQLTGVLPVLRLVALAWRACRSEGHDVHYIRLWCRCCVAMTPQEALRMLIFRTDPNLVEHLANVGANAHQS